MRQRFEKFLSVRYWPALDGLRALAIVPVVWHHVGGHRGGLWAQGPMGVELFFAISGFLITSLLLRERATTGRISLKGFYLRRSLRIFPLYYAVLGLYVLAVAVMEGHSEAGEQFFRNLIPYATYTSNWFVAIGPHVIFYFAWSLACEEQFYLLWPSIVSLTRPWGAAVAMAAILVALQFAPPAVWLAQPICLGCLAALLVHEKWGFGAAYRVLGRRWSAPVALAAVVVSIVTYAPLLVIGAAMTALVVACAVREDHGLTLLTWRPIRYVGEISYGIYLVHMLCVNAVRKVLPAPEGLLFLAALACSILVAGISHRWFERPVLRLKDRFAVRPVPVL